uniref:Glucose-methanol-choline oxidoreductase C-terminal domain-containing protein n=1 Tax=Anopheles epiroticus TaxID=199890 RepID=A0A182P798_9DIPT
MHPTSLPPGTVGALPQQTPPAYLYPIRNRTNLHVIRNAHVTKILLNPQSNNSRAAASDGWPDLKLLLIGGTHAADRVYESNFNYKPETFNALFGDIERRGLEGYTQGQIRLASADPFQYPIIQTNYLQDPYDLEISVRGIRKTIELSKTKALGSYGARLLDIPIPGCEKHQFDSDDYWKCFTRYLLLIGGTHAADRVYESNFNYKPETFNALFGDIERHGLEGYTVFPLIYGWPN